MADNYIEKRMEELRSGAASPSYSPRNLDALLAAAAKWVTNETAVESASEAESKTTREAAAAGNDPALKVHPLQLEAIARVNAKIQGACCVKCLADGSEPPLGDGAFIVVLAPDPQAPHLEFELGMRAEAMILKACELGLCAKALLDIDFEALSDAFEGACEEGSEAALDKVAQSASPSPATPVLALEIRRRK